MRDLKKALTVFDRKVNARFGFAKKFFSQYFPFVSTLFFVLIFVIFLFRFFYSRPRIVAAIIADDVKLITLALEKIDTRCNILSVEGDVSDVDFLNVKTFSGSQVGPLALAYPKRWEGPYVTVNPTLQDIFYEIVRAADGIFVMPGRGVRLPNGLTVGKEFMVTRQTKVSELIKESGPLRYEDSVFASKLVFKIGDWDAWHLKEETVRRLNRMLREINEAMPFTQNAAPKAETICV